MMIEKHTENDVVHQGLFKQLAKNKFLIIILVIALVLGLYLRFDDYAAEGYGSDDMNTIPAAVFAYYPHDYFPGLVSTEPPLGNYIIGLGCIASGEDFSQVKNVKPLFFPDRSAYIGKAARNAENYCWAPVYIFAIFFLIGIIIFAFSFFTEVYSATFFITFFIFFTEIISDSRNLKVDIIFFTFVIFALLFLWKGYETKKSLFKEKLYFFISFALLGLTCAIKFPAGLLVIFSFLLLLEKYSKEILFLLQKILEKIDIKIFGNKFNKEEINPNSLLINIALSAFSLGFFMMMFYNFSFKNLYDTYYYLTSLNNPGIQSFSPSITNFVLWLKDFLIQINILDLFVYFFSISTFVIIIFKKSKTGQEKFTLYLTLLGFFALASFATVANTHRGMPFMFGFFILMSLIFSDKKYSFFHIFKINRKYFLAFIIVYILISFIFLYSAPFHRTYRNPLSCFVFRSNDCKVNLVGFSVKPVSLYMDSILNENETFLPTGIYNYYIRHNDDILWWIFYSNFKKQTGEEPRLGDYLKYYRPEGRRVRYVHTDTSLETNPNDIVGIGIDQDILKKNYKPSHIIKLYNKDVAYIYDLDTLIKK